MTTMEPARAKSMRVSEVLKKAQPRPEGPSYRHLSGEIDERQYRRELETERKRLGLPTIRPSRQREAAG
jgi:5-formyltetrahydrofolate cyclo-ligase